MPLLRYIAGAIVRSNNMGRLPSLNRRYNLRSVQPIHREILRRIAAGQKNRQIADDLNVSEPMVSYTKNSVTTQSTLREMEAVREGYVLRATTRLSSMSEKCIDVLEGILDSEDTQIHHKIQVAKDLLDRAGVNAPRKVDMNVDGRIVTADVINLIKQRAVEAARRCGNVIDVEAKEA